MSHSYRAFSVFALIWFSFVKVSAQEYYFRHFNQNDGLSTMRIRSALQDNRGFIWFATSEGANYFDGHEFRVPSSESENGRWLKSSDVISMTEDIHGILWMCCNKGVCSYNPNTDSISVFRSNNFTITSAKTISSDNSGNIWVTNLSATFRLNPDRQEYVRYGTESLPTCSCLYTTRNGTVYLMSFNGGIYTYNPSSDSFLLLYQIRDLIDGDAHMVSAAECDDGKLVIATAKDGAVLFDPQERTAELLFDSAEDNPVYIHTVMTRSNGEIWFGAENGIWIYKLNVGILKHICKSYTQKNSLSDDVVHALLYDKEGGIWIGTFFGGVNYLMSENFRFKKYYPRDLNGHIDANIVRNIVQDNEGNMFVAMEDGLIYSFSQKPVGSFCQLSPLTWKGEVISDNIQAILPDGNNMWIGALYDGVFLSDKRGQILKRYDIRSIPVVLFRNDVGEIFLGTRTGLLRYDSHSDRFFGISGLEDIFVHSICQDSKGRIWVGTLDNGLYVLRHHADTYKAEKYGMDDESIATMYEDSKGNFWIGTQNHGVCIFDVKSKAVNRPNKALCDNGLGVCMIVEDKRGRLWMSTSNGLFCYNKKDDAVVKYNLTTLISSAHFNYNSAFVDDSSGMIYMGTVDGMIEFDPQHLDNNSPLQDVYFADVDIGKSSFSISFCVPHYQADRHLWFRYRIAGVDDNWNVVQEKYSVRYNNLSPGKYILQVSVSHDNINWSDKVSEYRFEIEAPFWLSAWAKSIYIVVFLSLLGLVSYLFWFRKRNIRRIAQFKQRNDQYIEMAKERMQFFTTITHEMRTPLTLILTPLESLIASFSQEKAMNLLPMIEKNARDLMMLINQVLDMKKLEQGNTSIELSKGDFIDFLRSVINPFRQVASRKRINFSFESDESIAMCFDKKKMQSVIYNLLSNAFKFTPKGGTVKVTAHKTNTAEIVVTVSDSGIGIPEAELDNIFNLFYQSSRTASVSIDSPFHAGSGIGLHLVKQFVQLHNGTITVESKDGRGCSFAFSLPTDLEETVHLTRVEPETDSSDVPVSDNADSMMKRPRLLLVDDNEDFLNYLNAELRDSYQTYLASNGQEALDIALKRNINIIVSDVMMPEMNGTELCRHIKSNVDTSHIKIILLTAKTADHFQLEGFQSGADCYITKPFSILILKDRIKYLCLQQQERYSIFMNKQNVKADELTSNSIDKEIYSKAMAKVMANIDNCNYGVEQFSSDMCMSRMTLYRKLLIITGKTPSEFIKTIRLKKAAELLSTNKYSVSEVTALTGFDNERSFYRSFKVFFGVTPSRYQSSQTHHPTPFSSDQAIDV